MDESKVARFPRFQGLQTQAYYETFGKGVWDLWLFGLAKKARGGEISEKMWFLRAPLIVYDPSDKNLLDGDEAMRKNKECELRCIGRGLHLFGLRSET